MRLRIKLDAIALPWLSSVTLNPAWESSVNSDYLSDLSLSKPSRKLSKNAHKLLEDGLDIGQVASGNKPSE